MKFSKKKRIKKKRKKKLVTDWLTNGSQLGFFLKPIFLITYLAFILGTDRMGP
jgi:hypothetical protein